MARSRARDESGFTLIELLIAMMLISLGVMALLGTFDHSRRTSEASEAQEAAVQVGEREVEKIVALGYGPIALSSSPATSSDPTNPNYWVSNSSPASYRYDQKGAGASETLAVAAGGGVNNDGGTWGDSRLGGRVYDYVTWVDDPCTACGSATDRAITNDYKRITVAVTANPPSALKKPVLISTIVTDPAATKGP